MVTPLTLTFRDKRMSPQQVHKCNEVLALFIAKYNDVGILSMLCVYLQILKSVKRIFTITIVFVKEISQYVSFSLSCAMSRSLWNKSSSSSTLLLSVCSGSDCCSSSFQRSSSSEPSNLLLMQVFLKPLTMQKISSSFQESLIHWQILSSVTLRILWWLCSFVCFITYFWKFSSLSSWSSGSLCGIVVRFLTDK